MLSSLGKTTGGLVAMILLGGCATFMDRNDFEEPRLYPATQMDAIGIRESIAGDSHFFANDSFKILQTASLIACTIDLPISVCTDTVMLPWDMKTKRVWKESNETENNPNKNTHSITASGGSE